MSKCKSALVVQSASDFAAVVSQLMPSTKVILNEDKDIARADDAWQEANPIPGIKTIHVIQSHPCQHIRLFHNALTPVAKPDQETSMPKEVEQTQAFKQNDWVLVKYDGKIYPGTVTAVDGSENFEASVMELAGKFWKWPTKPDKIYYTKDNVLCLVAPPEPAGRRGQYRFVGVKQLERK